MLSPVVGVNAKPCEEIIELKGWVSNQEVRSVYLIDALSRVAKARNRLGSCASDWIGGENNAFLHVGFEAPVNKSSCVSFEERINLSVV